MTSKNINSLNVYRNRHWINGIRCIYLILLILIIGTLLFFHFLITWLFYLVYSSFIIILMSSLIAFSLDISKILQRNESLFMNLPFDELIRQIHEQWVADSNTASYIGSFPWYQGMTAKLRSWMKG